jgi:integration host factor subunit alpha
MPPRKCLTKALLAEHLFEVMDIERQKAADLVEHLIEIIKESLEKDNKVMLSGFGTFVVNSKKPRIGRNPQTGEELLLRARKVVKFKPSQLLRKAISGVAAGSED